MVNVPVGVDTVRARSRKLRSPSMGAWLMVRVRPLATAPGIKIGPSPSTSGLEATTVPVGPTTCSKAVSSWPDLGRTAGRAPLRSNEEMASALSRTLRSTLATRDRDKTVTRIRAPAAHARLTTRAAPRAVRALTEPRPTRRRLPAIFIQAVAEASEGLDGLTSEGTVDLAAQVPDVDLHDVVVALEVATPDVLEDLGLRHHLAGPAQ